MPEINVEVVHERLSTSDGWSLPLRHTYAPTRLDKRHQPLLIVPGYGMNSFIFSYHPKNTSLERCLAEAGFDVWTMDLRGQGASVSRSRDHQGISIRNYAMLDLPAAISYVLRSSKSRQSHVTLCGCSLGGAICFAYLSAFRPHRVGKMIAIAAPLRWQNIHPLMRAAFASPTLARMMPVPNMRPLMRRLGWVLRRAPKLLSFYMNPASVDLNCLNELTKTVEKPNHNINHDIAVWLQNGDLQIDGTNVTEALGHMTLPLMIVLANRDGLVTQNTARSAASAWGSAAPSCAPTHVLCVGTERDWYAHANLFIGNDAKSMVFDPMVAWLRDGKPAI